MKSLRWIGLGMLLVSATLGLARAEDAAKIYATKCAMCHGKDAKGSKMAKTDLLAADVLAKTDAELVKLTIDGVKPKMPAYKGKIADKDIAAVIAYVRGLAPKDEAAEPAEDAEPADENDAEEK